MIFTHTELCLNPHSLLFLFDYSQKYITLSLYLILREIGFRNKVVKQWWI